jgi:hypothetical protein
MGPKVTSLVARSSRGMRCTQNLRRIRVYDAHPAWICRMPLLLALKLICFVGWMIENDPYAQGMTSNIPLCLCICVGLDSIACAIPNPWPTHELCNERSLPLPNTWTIGLCLYTWTIGLCLYNACSSIALGLPIMPKFAMLDIMLSWRMGEGLSVCGMPPKEDPCMSSVSSRVLK